jgi:rhodanese-related sulfurtransferase
MVAKVSDYQMPDGPYAGDVSARDAWAQLEQNSEALLIDVRTKIEWMLIGTPDLRRLGREPIYLQWLTAEGPSKTFLTDLKTALDARGATAATPLYFMCQSGGRSKVSAIQCTALGYSACYNVADGFEGGLDEHQHRNSISGWKVAGLPWVQT